MTQGEIGKLLDDVLFGYSERKIAQARAVGRQFVHYTSAEAALSIINNKEIWLRNSAAMNDYSEIAHGEACFRHVLFEDNETRGWSQQTLELVSPGLHDRIAQYFENSVAMRRIHTYLISISEHGPQDISEGVIDYESSLGRLSMWRAYGGQTGVALVLNPDGILTEGNALDVYLSPVLYGGVGEFAGEYQAVLLQIQKNITAIKALPAGLFEENLRRFVHFSSLSTKHRGFAEEREWRVTYSADPQREDFDDQKFNEANRIRREFRTINCTPQRIYKIPFVDYPGEGLTGATLPELLAKVIIGPTAYPLVLFDAFYVAMTRAGIPNAHNRIAISDIPLRT